MPWWAFPRAVTGAALGSRGSMRRLARPPPVLRNKLCCLLAGDLDESLQPRLVIHNRRQLRWTRSEDRPFLIPLPPPPGNLPCPACPLEGAHLSEGRACASPPRGCTQNSMMTPVVTKASKDMARPRSGTVLKTLQTGAQGSLLAVPRPCLLYTSDAADDYLTV